MTKLELLANVLEYMEQHITEDIHTDDIARACYCSRSSLESFEVSDLEAVLRRIGIGEIVDLENLTHGFNELR